jgi:NAD-dependent SIR2 family protein deacetylase
MTHPSDTIKEAATALAAAQSLLVITGAGISAESGLATSRDAQGVLTRSYKRRSVDGLTRNPQAVREFINEFAAVHPNGGRPPSAIRRSISLFQVIQIHQKILDRNIIFVPEARAKIAHARTVHDRTAHAIPPLVQRQPF